MQTRSQHPLLGALRRVDDLVALLVRVAVILLMAGMTVSVVAQVFSRYLLGFSLTWSEEVARLCMVCMIFLACAALVRDDSHLAVTSLRDLLPARPAAAIRALSSLTGLLVGLYLLRGSALALGREWNQLTPAIRLPMSMIYGTVTAALVLMCLWFAVWAIRHLWAAVRAVPPEPFREPQG